ncbi:uncharacterized protein BO66DRAFT_390529 [Aspergillus aculeatinus CBS 121060]|uniref:Uncharacterized protein n=1 Tax=Aspergillus aculeatinus CBS 121060 TaxID=1448322 RepID=A0ACD1HE05_9EURO|nr:hypothetical protein BO66DRAFT_390529 [Aspergillus aculeatinus CBS 121060]RAH71669.1 hypothetical protein BO66DRAFT_390529 [Aspergillus aculeatinus CBS 121060]
MSHIFFPTFSFLHTPLPLSQHHNPSTSPFPARYLFISKTKTTTTEHQLPRSRPTLKLKPQHLHHQPTDQPTNQTSKQATEMTTTAKHAQATLIFLCA